ncbi:hypothetical protein L195_g037569 [Trifolium pratense]|uniref:F-box associated beta-propeller type 1 domain-containing protein n=1 Tax=Trifolium pratense TaxID=57577 RepID=A0A2K3LSM8_TRIPR|nr:hypothetical protein L195_g037569 [Trifolium pratense]
MGCCVYMIALNIVFDCATLPSSGYPKNLRKLFRKALDMIKLMTYNYKVPVVAKINCDSRRERLTKIYTHGEDSWKTIQNFPSTSTVPLGKFVSGTLNRMVDNGGVSSNQSYVILSFDMEKETYGEVLLPQNDADDNVSMHRFHVLDNCLCVFFEINKTHWVAWLMKEYIIVDSWTKLMIIPHEKFIPNYPSFVHPLFVSKNGVVLLMPSMKR